MWLPDASGSRRARLPAALLAALLAAGTTAGCTARPLYSSAVATVAATGVPAGDMRAALAAINVAPVQGRPAQEVRNELIFLLSGGRGNAVAPAYSLTLSASPAVTGSTVTNTVGVEQAPTASTLTFTGIYTLSDAATGRIIGRGTRSAVASYDMPRQPFSRDRAARDAENRAARELAALLAAAIAADLATGRNAAASQ